MLPMEKNAMVGALFTINFVGDDVRLFPGARYSMVPTHKLFSDYVHLFAKAQITGLSLPI